MKRKLSKSTKGQICILSACILQQLNGDFESKIKGSISRPFFYYELTELVGFDQWTVSRRMSDLFETLDGMKAYKSLFLRDRSKNGFWKKLRDGGFELEAFSRDPKSTDNDVEDDDID